MLDVRSAIALESNINDQFTALSKEMGVSRGGLVTAIVTQMDKSVVEAAVEAYKQGQEARREQKKTIRKELNKKLKSITQEEIELILAARQAA